MIDPEKNERWQRERTARKRAEELLEEKSLELYRANEQLRALNAELEERVRERATELTVTQFAVDHAGDAMYWIDRTGRFTYVNQTACRWLDYTEDELLGMSVFEIDPAMQPQQWPAHWKELEARRHFTLESIHRTRDGREFPVEVSVNYIQAEGREFNCAFARDVSDRKAAEAELSRSEQAARRLSLVASRTTNAVILTDDRGRIEWVNAGFERITGFKLEEVVSRTPGAILQGPDSDPDTIAMMRGKVRAGEGFRTEIVNYDKARNPYWVDLEVQPIRDADGKLRQFMAIESDVTERKLREIHDQRIRRLRVHVDKLVAAMLGEPHSWSWMPGFLAEVVTTLELKSAGFLSRSASPLGSWEHTGDRCEPMAQHSPSLIEWIHSSEFWERVPSGRSVVTAEFPVPGGLADEQEASGSLLILPIAPLNAVEAVFYFEGHADGRWHVEERALFELVAQCVTRTVERWRTGAELESALREAESASLEKSAFLANMSHEIRTPMTAIVGYADLIARHDSQSGTLRSWSRQLRTNADYLLSLVNDVLDLSKIEAGEFSVTKEQCDLLSLVREALELVRPRANDKAIGLELECDTVLPAVIETDPIRLRQILINLLDNAIKFTDRGSVTLVLSIDPEGERVRLRLAVTDTGRGISPEILGKVFDPFVHEPGEGRRRQRGTGLGLSICRNLAEHLGGSIEVLSEEGRGSTFAVDIDAGPWAESVLLKPDSFLAGSLRDRSKAESEFTLAGMRIHVVDDTPENVRILTYMLEGEGATVTTSADGRAGVQAIVGAIRDGVPPHVVLMDMLMPELDGYAATRELRAGGCSIPILALTAYAVAGEREKCLDSGCDDYLTKPVRRESLRRALRKYAATEPSGERMPIRSTRHDETEFQPLLAAYISSLDRQLGEIQEAVADQDRDRLGRLSHQLKGSGASYGFPTITDVAAACESAVREAADWADVEDRCRALSEELSAALNAPNATPD